MASRALLLCSSPLCGCSRVVVALRAAICGCPLPVRAWLAWHPSPKAVPALIDVSGRVVLDAIARGPCPAVRALGRLCPAACSSLRDLGYVFFLVGNPLP